MKAFIGQSALNVVEDLLENFSTLENDTREYTRRIFYSKEIQDFIVAANIRNLEEGLRADGTQIKKTPEGKQKSTLYERYTIYNRSEEGLQTHFVDLKQTGFFYKSLKVRAGSNDLLEFSDDPKSAELERIWGNILGISGEDVIKLQDTIIPKIIKFVNDKLKPKA